VEGECFMHKFIFFMLALLTTVCIMLVGIAIGEGSWIGIVSSIVGSFIFIGIGFRFRKRFSAEKE
jgi:heme O synthase-like polyprenyltransferase